MMSKQYPSFFLGVAILTIASAYAQSPNVFCVTSAKPLILRSEGLAERVGEIVYDCSGQPGTQVTANLTLSLNVNMTNRLSSGNTLTGIILTIDTGSGPQAQPILPVLMSPGALVFNGLSFTLSQRGTAQLVVADIRANPTQAGANVPLLAFLGVSHTSLALTSATVNVGNPQRGLFSSLSSRIVCTQAGSPLPDTISFSNLVTGHTEFASTRITEGFADALQPRGGYANLNADSGERIIVRYSGFPQGARLFVPDFIAGSDAVQPTAGGDFGLPASGGAFAASASGSLLLARVDGSDVNGARGGVVFNPAIFGEGSARFRSEPDRERTISNVPRTGSVRQRRCFRNKRERCARAHIECVDRDDYRPSATFQPHRPAAGLHHRRRLWRIVFPDPHDSKHTVSIQGVGHRFRSELYLHPQHRFGSSAVVRQCGFPARFSYRMAHVYSAVRPEQCDRTSGCKCREASARHLHRDDHRRWRSTRNRSDNPRDVHRRTRPAFTTAAAGCDSGHECCERCEFSGSARRARLSGVGDGRGLHGQVRRRYVRRQARLGPVQ